MKRRIISVFMVCALVLALTGTASAASTSNVAAESRSGVTRVATFVTAELYTVENGRLAERIDGVENVLGGTGTAFGVGTAGQPTDIFVTNNHVISDSVSVLQTDEEGNPIIALSQTVNHSHMVAAL